MDLFPISAFLSLGFEVSQAKRGPLRYDGEIDHGLTSGIHGAGIYLLKDPDLGMVAYGGNVEVDKKGM